MTNFEKYRDDILEFITKHKNSTPVPVRGKFDKCRNVNCDKCNLRKEEYHGISCNLKLLLWLYEEYQEPKVDWSTVAVDTPILVSVDAENWENRHFAKYENGTVYAWEFGRTSWTVEHSLAWKYAKLAEDENNV